ncbi:hypothetical protein NLJ89_g9887 [Agrocybe chaxingu]|uniref:JmjC domain-containing protein n=1 Tax=Agrocybe chaxingu TaxID=84603 RepID=A0A9W8JV40_9AGAR|nr:hypothetical protein NLJ89_g9887 [Agrocybe chaxingu]
MESATRLPPRRMLSPILSSMPWTTPLLIWIDDLNEFALDPMENFIQSLMEFEKDVAFSPAIGGESTYRLQGLLGIDVNDTDARNVTKIPQRESANARDHMKLCSLLAAYRITEYFLERVTVRLSVPQLARASVRPAKTLKGFDQLKDWTKVLIDLEQSTDALMDPATLEGKPWGLVDYIKYARRNIHISKALINILVAAWHIAFLIEFKSDSKELPDLPDNLDSLNSADYLSVWREGMRAVLDDGTGKSNNKQWQGGALRSPLHLALLISPLYLLLSVQLIKNNFSREAVIEESQYFRALGNRRPPLLLAVEDRTLLTVCNIAAGANPIKALKELFKSLPMEELKACDWQTRSFFCFDDIPTPATICEAPSASHMIAADGERPQETSALTMLQTSHTEQALMEVSQPHGAPMSVDTDLMLAAPLEPPDDPLPPAPMPSARASETGQQHNDSPDESSAGGSGTRGDVSMRDLFDDKEGRNAMTPSSADKSKDDGSADGDDTSTPVADLDAGDSNDDEVVMVDLDMESAADRLPPLPAAAPGGASDDARPDTNKSLLLTPPATRKSRRDKKSPVPFTETPAEASPKKVGANKRKPMQDANPQSSVGGSSAHRRESSTGRDVNNPIDVDAWTQWESTRWKHAVQEERTSTRLDSTEAPPKIKGMSINLWDTHGNVVQLEPEVHFEEDNEFLQTLVGFMEQFYLGGRPQHVADTENSAIAILTYEEYSALTPKLFQSLLSKKHAIVVKNWPTPDVQFNEAGLDTLEAPSVITLQVLADQSIKVGQNQNLRLRDGTVAQLLEASFLPSGKILNALEFPLSESPSGSMFQPFSTDMAAWRATKGLVGAWSESQIPVSDIRWALAALQWAMSFWHIDSDGFCTFVDVLCGQKWWMIGVPPEGIAELRTMFLRPGFDPQKINEKIWKIEGILLPRGSRLFMRPNVPHAVVTPSASICHGGHFYCMSTIQQTSASLMHSFVCSTYITNTTHHPSRLLLRRMIQFCHQGIVRDVPKQGRDHLPDVTTIQGVVDLLTLCNLNILGNVLDHRTYSAPNQQEDAPISDGERRRWMELDVNDVPLDERNHMRYARGMSLHVFGWVRAHMSFVYAPISEAVDLPALYLAHQALVLEKYKDVAEQYGVTGAPNCTKIMLKIQLDNALRLDPLSHKIYTTSAVPRGLSRESLLLGDLGRFTYANKTVAYSDGDFKDFQKTGTTERDTKYLKSRSSRVENVETLSGGDNDREKLEVSAKIRQPKRQKTTS